MTLHERLEWLVCRSTGQKPRGWIELHPLRTRPPAEPSPDWMSGFDALLELARI